MGCSTATHVVGIYHAVVREANEWTSEPSRAEPIHSRRGLVGCGKTLQHCSRTWPIKNVESNELWKGASPIQE